jgi:hypothetical protein
MMQVCVCMYGAENNSDENENDDDDEGGDEGEGEGVGEGGQQDDAMYVCMSAAR